MTTTLAIYKYLYPFLLGLTLMLLYQKQYRFMRRFYGRMTLYWNARRFYNLVIYSLLLLYNYTHYVADGITPGIIASVVFMTPLLFFRVADRWFHLLHEHVGHLLLLILTSMLIALADGMAVASVTLLTIGVAAMFYPSEHVLDMKSRPECFSDVLHLTEIITKNYYGRPTQHLAFPKKHLAQNNHNNHKKENQ